MPSPKSQASTTWVSILTMVILTSISVAVFSCSFVLSALHSSFTYSLPSMIETCQQIFNKIKSWSSPVLQQLQSELQSSSLAAKPFYWFLSLTASAFAAVVQWCNRLWFLVVQRPYTLFVTFIWPLQHRLAELIYSFMAMLVVCSMVIGRFSIIACLQIWSLIAKPSSSPSSSTSEHFSYPKSDPFGEEEFWKAASRTTSPTMMNERIPSPSFEERLRMVSPSGTMNLKYQQADKWHEQVSEESLDAALPPLKQYPKRPADYGPQGLRKAARVSAVRHQRKSVRTLFEN